MPSQILTMIETYQSFILCNPVDYLIYLAYGSDCLHFDQNFIFIRTYNNLEWTVILSANRYFSRGEGSQRANYYTSKLKSTLKKI